MGAMEKILTRSAQAKDALVTLANIGATIRATLDNSSIKVPAGGWLKRRAASKVGARLAWGVVPVLGIGLAVWGVRVWRRNKQQRGLATETPAHVPPKDVAAPRDLVDESSWESFPASDPPAVSPGPAKPMQPPTVKGAN